VIQGQFQHLDSTWTVPDNQADAGAIL